MQSPPRHLLSKSTYMNACQCPKKLWLGKYMPDEKDELTEGQTAIFQQGTDVGMLAQQLFPKGVDASPESYYDFQKSVVDTAKYISEGQTVIYEAAFQFEGVLCAIDIMVKKGNNWYGYEVKSSTLAKNVFVQDAALQYYVTTNSGIPLSDISIIHLNNKYIRSGELDIQQLFTIQSILDKVLVLQNDTHNNIDIFKNVLEQKSAPEISMGKQCNKPYVCSFIGYCSKNAYIEEPNYGQANIDKKALAEFIDQLEYPLYYMDFETWMTAVPQFDGHWSYRSVPFQFSIHKQESTDAVVEHFDYLADGWHSPLLEFTEKLLNILGDKGSIIVYNKTFENTILSELKNDFQNLSDAIKKVQDRIIDLMIPFKKKHYYMPEMEGSYSIKYVLPALITELSYNDLEISDGSAASSIFSNLKNEEDQTKVLETRENLLEYCGLDTFAMVKILEKIKNI